MIDWYENYDEINAELTELSLRHESAEDSPAKRLFVGSGEDICTFRMEGSQFNRDSGSFHVISE